MATEYVGKRRLKDLDTGEIIEVDCVQKTSRDLKGGWRRVYLADFLSVLDEIGNAKIEVLQYILEHIDSNNKIGKSYRQIAREAKVSLFTVQTTLKALINKKLVKKVDSFLVIMPDIVASFGSDAKNARLLTEYSDVNLFNYQDHNDEEQSA
jgi:predicted transcriptional regulator